MTRLTVALSKGRILDETLPLLERAGLTPSEDPTSSRKLIIPTNVNGVSLVVLRATDVPTYVQHGAADLGVAGKDVLLEHGGDGLYRPLDLGIGRCRLVVATRRGFDWAGTVQRGARIRVATKYERVAREHFAAKAMHVDLIKLYGSMELAPLCGLADAIVDLVSTGSTLRTNGLRELDLVLESTALLVARRELAASAACARELGRLAAALESVLRARDKRYLMANVPRATLEATRRILPGITGPTVVDLLDGNGHVAVHAVVEQAEIYRVIAELKGIGAAGILVTRIERLMP